MKMSMEEKGGNEKQNFVEEEEYRCAKNLMGLRSMQM